MSATRRVAPGVYETPDGFRITRLFDADDEPTRLWNLYSVDGSWCNTFGSKADALDAVETIRLWDLAD